jgi:hypothetical protein
MFLLLCHFNFKAKGFKWNFCDKENRPPNSKGHKVAKTFRWYDSLLVETGTVLGKFLSHPFRRYILSWLWWLTPAILALRRLWRYVYHEFKTSLRAR